MFQFLSFFCRFLLYPWFLPFFLLPFFLDILDFAVFFKKNGKKRRQKRQKNDHCPKPSVSKKNVQNQYSLRYRDVDYGKQNTVFTKYCYVIQKTLPGVKGSSSTNYAAELQFLKCLTLSLGILNLKYDVFFFSFVFKAEINRFLV